MQPAPILGTSRRAAPLPAPSPRSTWSPLRHTIFRWLWIASVASNVGTWFQNVGASWMMTTLSPSPALVAMVQAATSLPMFLLSLPAGAVADVLDRRRPRAPPHLHLPPRPRRRPQRSGLAGEHPGDGAARGPPRRRHPGKHRLQ